MSLRLTSLLGAASAVFLAAAPSTTSARTSAAEAATCTILTESACYLHQDRLQEELSATEQKWLLLGCLNDHGCDPYEGKKLSS